MLAELDLAMNAADQKNQGSARASAFREGAQMEQAKDKMAAQAAGAEAYRSAASAGPPPGNERVSATPYGGPGNTASVDAYRAGPPPPSAGTANFNAAFDQQMANPSPMDATQGNQQVVDQELAARQALMNRNAVANMPIQPGGATPAPGAGGPYQPPPGAAPGGGIDPRTAAELDAIQRTQLGAMQGPPATQLAGAAPPGGGLDPQAAAYLRARGLM